MTRVLVVHHDADVADNEADAFRRAGYEVTQCAGPTFGPCPIHAGHPCPWIADVDVVVYDVWASGESAGGRDLIEGIVAQHPGVPMVLTSAGMEPDWLAGSSSTVVVLDGAPHAAQLISAIERALGSSTPSA